MSENTLFSQRAQHLDEREIMDGVIRSWKSSEEVVVDRYWNGKKARLKGSNYQTLTRINSLWSESSLFFKFECRFDTLCVNSDLGLGGPIDELWEFDVLEVFLRPPGSPDYFEFEVSPLGQWLDVHVLKPRVEVDFGWESHLETRVSIDEGRSIWSGVLKIPYEPILKTVGAAKAPVEGDIWGLNLFRIAGKEPEKEYLSWRPTLTPDPDFHVPAAFGHLIFLNGD
jgi:alpha-galactosidase